MIKVQNNITRDRKNPVVQVLIDEMVKEALLDKGIVLGNHSHPDYVFEMANELKNPKPNTIAFEKLDGCQIKNKALLENPNLIRLVKMYKYRDLNVSNLSCVDGRIFTRFLTDDRKEERQITEEGWNKVVLGTSFLHYKRHDMAELIAKQTDFSYKENDVFFAGTTQYGDENHKAGVLISQHRKNCLRTIKGLKRAIKVKTGGRQAFRARDYLKNLANAKVTVSPWGWGESCYRDYEALMLGTDVIKPRSYQILTNPDIYTDTVFYCKPDWSNLDEVIEGCLETWEERKAQREETSKRLIECRQPKAIAGILENIIKGIK